MISAILLAAILCLVMVLPYLPGRFDASAATFSFVVQVASYVSLLMVPVGLAWMVSRRRSAIQHSAALIAEIESFRQRRGHYPVSLQSKNPDFPTGVVGIERFHYEPNGEAYNLFFVRPHIELDAEEAVVFNPRDEHHFTSHQLDILQYDGEQLDLRRGDRRRTWLTQPHWISILLD